MPVRDLADVDQPLDPAEVDEGAEVAHRAHPPLQDVADLQPLPGLRRLLRRLLVEQRAARDDDVAAAALDLGDAEAQALADVLRRLAAAAVDLRPRTEGAHRADLHLVAALHLRGHQPLDGDAVRQRLLELAGDVAAAADGAFQHHRARAAAVVHHRRLDLVADRQPRRARGRVDELGEVDHRLALAADLDEGAAPAERDHPTAHHLAHRQPLRRLRLARRQQRGEVLFLALIRHVPVF
ncbi:MAG: hypothetical protein U0802_03065 [Candidatus Binatia bacterium]